MSKPKKPNRALVRRQRISDLRTLLWSRYGQFLPDDDAGREDLQELLLPISTGADPSGDMRREIKNRVPWMSQEEATLLIDHVNRIPAWLRKPSSRELGERMRLTNAERERLKILTIKPFDRTDEELAAQRKVKRRECMRQKRKRQSRDQYLAQFANCLRKTKPWLGMGISRRTYYRRLKTQHDTGCVNSIKSIKQHQPGVIQPSLTIQKRLAEQRPNKNKSQSACRKRPVTVTTPTVVVANATNRWRAQTQSQKKAMT